MRYYSRSSGTFVDGEPPATNSSIVNISPIDNSGDMGVANNPNPESLVRNDAGLSSAYNLEQYQADIKNDMDTTGGKNLAKIKATYEAYNPTPTTEQVAKQTQLESLGNLSKDLTQFEEGLKKSEFRGKLAGNISLPFGINVGIPSGTGLTPQSAAFDAQRTTLAYSLAKALAQQTGQGLSDKDVKNFMNLLPSRSDTETEAALKMTNIRQMISNRTGVPFTSPNVAGTETTTPSGARQEAMKKVQDVWTSSSGEKMNLNAGAQTENLVNNIVDIVKGVPQFAGMVANLTPLAWIGQIVKGEKIDPLIQAKTTVELGKGLLQSLAQVTGINENTVNFKDGHFYWNPGQMAKDALVHDVNHPLDLAMWVLPFLKEAKGSGGVIGKAADSTPALEQTLLNQVPKPAGTLPEISLKARGAARGVLTSIPEDFIKSEEITSKALRITKSNSYEGMGRELKAIIPEEGAKIEKWATAKDATIGMQSVDEVVNQIMDRVKQTSAAQANPQLIPVLEADLKAQLTKGPLEGGLATGNIEGTNFSALNSTRKYLGSNLDSWFKNGQPLGTATNDLNAMKWEAAGGIKDIMAQADRGGEVATALEKQHTAIQTYPAISEIVTQPGAKLTPMGWRVGVIRKAFDLSGAGKLYDSIKIGKARSLQGDLPIINSPTEVVAPVSNVLPPIQSAGALPQTPSARPFPLPDEIINNVLKGKGPAQSERLVRDMRYKQGNPQFRGTQDQLLKEASKKKYK